MRRGLLIVLLLAGCAQNRGEIREVARPAPPEPARPRRFELELVASVGSDRPASRSLELWVPVASSEPGIQTVELTSACIAPDSPSELTQDARGNRFLHVKREGPGSVSVRVRQRILRQPPASLDLSKAVTRPLTAPERTTLEPELGFVSSSTLQAISLERVSAATRSGRGVTDLRDEGVPMRLASGLELVPGGVSPVAWLEAYIPGLAWTAFVPEHPPGELPGTYLVISRGARGTPWAIVDGERVNPGVVIERHDLPDEP